MTRVDELTARTPPDRGRSPALAGLPGSTTMQDVGGLLRRATRSVIISGLALYLLMQAAAMVGRLAAAP